MLIALTILKYLLWILLFLLLLLLFLLFFLLFVPFRYKLDGKKEREEEHPKGEFSLRFPLMHFQASYQEEKLSYSGKILFFTIFEGGKE
ncbi:hypothetical protein [Oribacterium sp. oral taxon 108]|uniref:hypothetical protein n=1 Tax=Oribacterium sp. oral taxon 108 TaxID=712414 RepID=UPI00020DD8DB|nr:hypothetical protein [Oribacterium sp. oral taxon 108]EGL36849.1 hypothetical protein HMPREF9124_1196 [Oribacterium sp. oral taxon 108 str. F0425]